MAIIKKTVWANPEILGNNWHSIAIHTDNVYNDDYIKIEVSYEVLPYTISLNKTAKGYCLTNSNTSSRLPYKDFKDLVATLRMRCDCQLSWDIYPGQPIWVFCESIEYITQEIESFSDNIRVTCLE